MQLSDVLIHLNDNISHNKKQNGTEELHDICGVIAPRFSNVKNNQLPVFYNPDNINALTLKIKAIKHSLSDYKGVRYGV